MAKVSVLRLGRKNDGWCLRLRLGKHVIRYSFTKRCDLRTWHLVWEVDKNSKANKKKARFSGREFLQAVFLAVALAPFGEPILVILKLVTESLWEGSQLLASHIQEVLRTLVTLV